MALSRLQQAEASGRPAELLELELEVPRAEVRRYLGYPPGRRPAASVAARIEELLPLAASLTRARGAVRLVSAAEVAPTGLPRPSAELAVGLCTIGGALEQESDRRGAAGDPLGALVLDAYGSAAAEAAAQALAAHACARAAAVGLRAGPRVSPGYGRWPVTAQPALLGLLPSRELCVSLTEGLMMIPRKSVSFAVRLRPAEEAGRQPGPGRRSPCRVCGRETCPYRHTRRGNRQGEAP